LIREYLKNHILITDGATGTYYAELTGDSTRYCELANVDHPERIRQIHTEYIKAGAHLIRTNTFAANSVTLNLTRDQLKPILVQAVHHARTAVGNGDCFIAANIGPIPRAGMADLDILDEYRFLVDTFLDEGLTVFNFETFSDLEYLPEITGYIKSRMPNAFIITQFTITADGFTRKGIRLEKVISQLQQIASIDAYGFNCGVGPAHLNRLLEKMDWGNDLVAALPNAGYPEIINERTVYVHNPEYFAGQMLRLKDHGIKILGGCCGTTPLHIQALVHALQEPASITAKKRKTVWTAPNNTPKPSIMEGATKDLIVAVELDPPFDTSFRKILDGASVYKEAGIDLVTIADSPMGKARIDSVAMAAKIRREIGVETLPHLCCRDRNINAIKSTLLAAHMEGIRSVLAVTGDPLPDGAKEDGIKHVFNLNSLSLIRFINELNRDIFPEDPFTIAAALNLNAQNRSLEIERMHKKAALGASLFLTQPVFSDAVCASFATLSKPHGVKILAGILPIVNRRNALFLQNELPGVTIPDELINRFTDDMSRDEAQEIGIQLAVEIAEKLRPFVDGFYFITPFNRTGMIVEILQRLQLCK